MSNRSKFSERLSAGLNITRKSADTLLELFTDILREHMIAEGEAVLPGFGRLSIKTRAPRRGHNPKTGAPIEIAARTVVGFKSFPGILAVPVKTTTPPETAT